jgi:hypothetical protein
MRLLGVALAGALLAGCSTPEVATAPDPTTAPSAAVSPAAASIGLDGLYHGTSTRYEADRKDCPHPGLVTLFVQNGQFTYRWDRLTDVPAAIGADGSVSGQEGSISLSGHLVGDQLQGDLTNGACSLHFTTRRRFSGA